MRLAMVFAKPILEAVVSMALVIAALGWTMRLIAPPI